MDNSNAKVRLYRKIAEFVADEAVETEEVDTEWLFSIITKATIAQQAKQQIARSSRAGETILKIEVQELEFIRGKKFKITGDTYYVECQFSGTARKTVRNTPVLSMSDAELLEWAKKGAVSSPLPSSHSVGKVFLANPNLWTRLPNALNLRQVVEMLANVIPPNYRIRFMLQVSARISADHLVAIQADDFDWEK